MSLDLLVLAAHPDDAELSCGGWLALCALRGQRAGVVDLTRGERATHGTPEERDREAAEAAAVLGLVARENLRLPDGGLRGDDPAQLDAVVSAIRRLRPSILLAPWRESRHPDHAAAHALAAAATFLAGLRRYRPELGEPFRPPRLLSFADRLDASAELVVDITEVRERKAAAIACHRSQFAPASGPAPAPAAFQVRDAYWGASIGVLAGEPYLLGSPLPVSDPVAHFAAHPAAPLLVPAR